MQPEHDLGPPELERELAARLAALDEMGTAGAAKGLGELTAGLGAEAVQRLGDALECVQKIRGVWPRPDVANAFPQQFGKFVLERVLGRGGHGVVYLALDPSLGRRVALKVPLAECLDDPDMKRRFFREARAVAPLDHPGIVPLLESGEVGAICYMASTYCRGPDLGAWLKERQEPLSPRAAAHLAAEIAEAIGHAHQHGVIHRDLKPRNILLEEAANSDLPDALPVRPRVTDFGLAKLLEAEADLTRTGLVVGTPRYMAPEQAQARHDAVGPATDVYAIGAILQELLNGRIFRGSEADDDGTSPVVPPRVPAQNGSPQASKSDEPPMARPERPPQLVPSALRAVVSKCLEEEPRRRYTDGAHLAADLRRFLAGEPVHAARWTLLRSVRAWAASRPGLAGLMAVIAAMIVTAVAFKLPGSERSEGKPAAPIVKDTGTTEAERLARVNRYVDDMRLAGEQSPLGDSVNFKLAQANLLLERHRPSRGEEDIRSMEWHYLWNHLHGERQTLKDHKGEVYWLTYSPDGRLIGSAGVDGARIWDAVTGALRLNLREHTDEVNWVSFSPDNKRVATASDDRSVRLWSAGDGSRVLPPLAHQNKVVASLFTPDGRQLITADRGGFLTIWDATTGACVRRFLASTSGTLEGMALSPDGSLLATAAFNCVTLWDYPALRARRAPIRADKPHGFGCVAFSHDGQRYATAGGSDNDVRVWETRTGALLFSRNHHPGASVPAVAFSPDDRKLVSVGSDLTARLWDLSGVDASAVLAGHADVLWCGAFAPDGKTLATTGKDSTVKLWTLPFVAEAKVEPSMDACHAVGHSADGRHLYTIRDVGQCERWDGDTGRPLDVLPFSPGGRPVAAAFSPGSARIASVNADGTVSIGSPREARPRIVHPRAAAAIPCLTFSSDGRMLAFVARDGSVTQIDCTRPGSAAERLVSPGSAPTCLAYGPSGGFLAGAVDRHLAVWDLRTHRVRGVSQASTQHHITAAAISPDGSLCATNGQDRGILLWDSATLDVKSRLSNAPSLIDCVAFSEDGRTLVSAGSPSSILLWNAATGRQILPLKEYDFDVPAVRGLCVGPGCVSAILVHEGSGRAGDVLWRTNLVKPAAGNSLANQ